MRVRTGRAGAAMQQPAACVLGLGASSQASRAQGLGEAGTAAAPSCRSGRRRASRGGAYH